MSQEMFVHANGDINDDTRSFAPFIKPQPVETVFASDTPQATATHQPVPHGRVLSSIWTAVSKSSFDLGRNVHQLSHEGNRYYGVMELKPKADQLSLIGDNSGGGTLLLGVRNSHDKSFRLGLLSGHQVTVCSNGCFSGEVNVRTKHSVHVLDRLDELIEHALHRYSIAAHRQKEQLAAYQTHELSDSEANDLFVRAMQAGAISGSKLPKAVNAYYDPPHPEFKERNLWSWVNSVTEVYKDLSVENVVQRSPRLHAVACSQAGLTLAT